MTPAEELVVACCEPSCHDRGSDRLLHLLDAEPDWEQVVRVATAHGVAALVFRQLSQARGGECDPRTAPLRARFFANGANSLLLTRELVTVLASLEQAGIAAVPYKGPPLALALYGNLLLREFTDLDLLVRPDDALRAREVLIAHGYTSGLLAATTARDHMRVHGEYRFRLDRALAGGNLAFELHWRIPAAVRLDHDAFWRRLQSRPLLGTNCLCFAPEDLLLILSVHGLQHAWNTLKWVVDIAQLLRPNRGLVPEQAMAEAQRVGALRVVLIACAIAGRVLAAPLPPAIESLVRSDRVVTTCAEMFCAHLFGRPLRRVGLRNQLRILDRTSDRVRYGLGLLGHLAHPRRLARHVAHNHRR